MSEERIKEHKKDLEEIKKRFKGMIIRTIIIIIITPILLNMCFGISIFYSALFLSILFIIILITAYYKIKECENILKEYESFVNTFRKKPKIDISKKWK